ncbi:MAG: M1 family aminopeptidase [Bacteroidetes bacterium]|nr:M1 family aminopeptidase [Bacteroidota bacterium]
MKTKLTLLLVLLMPYYLISQELIQKKGWEMCALRKSSKPVEQLDLLSPNSPKHKFDVLNYTIDIDLYNNFKPPFPNTFYASVVVTFRIDTALNTIQLNARNTSLTIDNVSIAGISFTHLNNILTITLDQTYNPGEVAEVRIDYHHNNVNDGAFYVDNGFVFTDCEPEGARKWFPCWDQPSDKAILDLTAKVPSDVKLGSNGHLEDSVATGDSIYYHWVTRDPLSTYLMVMTGKVDYNLDIIYWTDPATPSAPPTPIRFYYNQGENPIAMEALFPSVCDYFSERFGTHPFEKNGFATLSPQFAWGGMENQTLTSLCPNCWYESVVVHEFAHQWFGDMATCATWGDVFLNEGFATYLEALWYEHESGYTAYKNEINSDAGAYLNGNPGWAIANPNWFVTTPPVNELFNYAITYAKGACVLHQLRYVMGDSAFWAGMKLYATDSLNIKYQGVKIIDFKQHMEQACGQNLDYFFSEWINLPNHPVYHNTYNITNMGGGTWRVFFRAKQTQTNPPFFQMPIEIKVKFTNNTDTVIRVMNDVNNQIYNFDFTHQPNQVTFDPANQIVLKRDTTTVGIDEPLTVQSSYRLFQNYPNPAEGTTEIEYEIPVQSQVIIILTDITGKKIREVLKADQSAGTHHVMLNTAGLEPGMFFYQLQAGKTTLTRRMVITR